MAIEKVLKGIPFLKQELTKIFMKRAADKSGIMQIPFKNKKLQLDIENRLQKYISDAERQGVDLNMVSNENLKYTINLNENVDPLSRVISADSLEGKAITDKLFGKRGEVVDMTGKKIDTSQGIMGGKSVEELMKSGQVKKGTEGLKPSKKVQDREMFEGANKRLRGPVKGKMDMGEFGKVDVETDYSASLDRPEFFDPKALNMYKETVKTGPEFFKAQKEQILNLINRKKSNMVPPTHSNYKLLKKSLQDQEDALEAIKVTEDLGGNENMFDFLRTKNIADYKSKPLKRSNYVRNETEQEIADRLNKKNLDSLQNLKNKLDNPDDIPDFADGGVAGLLGERTGYQDGNGVADEDAEKAALGKRVRELMDEGYDFGEAVKEAMKEGYADGGRTGFAFGGTGGKTSSKSSSQGPAGGASAGGKYGGNRNKKQTYGGSIFRGGSGKTTTTTTTTPKTNTGITSNYMNPTFRKATINFLNRKQPPKSFIANLKNIYTDDVTPAKTFNTMEELIGIGAAKEGLFGNKLTSEGKTLGNFMKSSKKLATKNPNVSPSLDSVKNWMGADVRQNTYKDYMDPNNPTQFNSTIQNAIDQGLFSDKEDFTNQVNILDLAQGGPARQNFSMGKRAFLKLIGSGIAGIAGLKSGILGLSKGGAKKAVSETVKQSATSGTPPPYFFKLVEKIKTLGDDTLATKDKAIAKKYKDYTMQEDFAGNIEIIKKGDDVAEDVFMSYKVDDVPVKGKKGSKKVEEYEEYTARPDAEGKMKDIEQGVPDSVVMEVEAGSGNVPESFYTGINAIKKADGGRIGFKFGSGKGILAVKGILQFLKNLKIKQSGDNVKDFISKRQFIKDIFGNTEKNRKARQLAESKENLANYMKQYRGYKFPSDKQIRIDLEKKIQPILNKDRKLNATGGLANMLGE